MNQNLITIKTTCIACQGHTVLETGQTFTLCGRIHPQVVRCECCDGKGTMLEWLDVHQLADLLDAVEAEREFE